MLIDSNFPKILGSELYRPTPDFIIPYVARPTVKYDFSKGPGDTVQLDRYLYWDEDTDASLTKEARLRADTQVIGTGSSRAINKDVVTLFLQEFTGPADPFTPDQPSTFKISMRQIMAAQRAFWQYGMPGFHNSIGSSNLLQDYRRWHDRLYINEFLQTSFIYNPRNAFADGGSVNLTASDFEFRGAPTMNSDDISAVVADMSSRFAPKFEDGNYGCICSPKAMQLLQTDPIFREIVRYPGGLGGQMYSDQMIPPAADGAPPQIPYGAPPMGNVVYKEGIFHGQARNILGQTTMPTGFVFNGVRFFVSNNLPKAIVPVNYTNVPPGSNLTTGLQDRTGELFIFFGPQAVGTALAGAGPEVLLNRNDDFGRFVIAIWRTLGDWKLLDERFVTVARSFTN